MRQYETFELTFSGAAPQDQWAAVDLEAAFTCGGKTTAVKGFYDGGGRYKVRFLPEDAGEYRWKATGIFSAEGEEACASAHGNHGPVRAGGTHFQYADGTPFLPFGTTVYALASQDDALVDQTIAALKNAPFNKIRMCVFPKHYDYNHNDPPCYPFEKRPDGAWNTGRPNTAFWHRFEAILDRIGALGIQIDLILFHPYDRWGFASLPQADNLQYLDYLLRRLSAKPYIWWSLANEYDLCGSKSLSDWEEIEAYVADNDPYRHLLSSHNCFCFWDFSRERVTHCSIQTKALSEIPRWLLRYRKPVIIDECCYEGDLPHAWGSISGREMVYRFWRCVCSGSYCTHGETFLSDDGVLWWARGGSLKGESPRRIAFLRQIMESLPGQLEPWITGWGGLNLMTPEQIKEKLEAGYTPGDSTYLALASIQRMRPDDRAAHLASERIWRARCGEEAFLQFFSIQTSAECVFELPEDKRYRVELIDVWEMTRTVQMENVCGSIKARLPGKEGMAVLITRNS